MIGDTQLNQFNLSDIMQNAQAMQARKMQLDQMQRQQTQQQEQQSSLADLVSSRAADGSYDTKGPAFQRFTQANPEGALGFLDKFDAQQHDKIKQRTQLIGEAAQWADTPQKWDTAIDYLAQLYPDLAQYKGRFSPETRMAALSAAGQLKEYYDRTKPVNMAPGNQLVDPSNGNIISKAPFAPHYGTVSEGQSAYVYNPNGGGSSGPLSVDSLLPAIVAQESRGNYAARNPSTGALGAYQVMPATGAALAQRLGLPWHPELMAADTPQARQYQDAIGKAAVQEAVDNSGGDPAVAASYYHGGSDRSKWGPKTRQYASEVSARLGGGAQVIAQGAPKAGWQTLSPQEAQAAGLPPGVYQRSPQGEIKPVSGTAGKPSTNDPGYSQSAMDAFDRAIGSIETLKKHPGFGAAVGSGFDPAAWGSFNPANGKPLGGTKAAGFIARLNTLKAQVFLPMVQSMKGMGALSNAEGEKLTAAIGALDTSMPEDEFKTSLDQIKTDLNTYRARFSQQAPTSPKSGGGDVDAILRKHGVLK